MNRPPMGARHCLRALVLASIGAATVAVNGAAVAGDLPSARIAARQKFFGIENVDAKTGALPSDRVIFSWLTNSTFAASFAGRIVLLDTFATRLETDGLGRTPFVIGDLLDLSAEAILLGHGHFDHADNAAYISAKTGIPVYATEETCAAMQTDFARMKADPVIQGSEATRFSEGASVQCVTVTTRGSAPGTQVVRIPVLEPDACVIAFRHLHSIEVEADPDLPPSPAKLELDPRDLRLFPPRTSLTPAASGERLPGQMNITTSGDKGPGGAASLFFDFVMRGGTNFTIAWNNSAGALKEGKGMGWDGSPADGARLTSVMRSLPFTDLHMGTASSANFNKNGLRDLIQYQDALKPRIFIPNHLTSGVLTRESASMSVFAGYTKQLELMRKPRAEWPQIRWLVDPIDYAVPISFPIDDPAWQHVDKKSRIAQFCGP